jgi:hypothetical protein
MRVAPLPPGRRRVRFALHRSRFFGAERQVRVEADLHAGGGEGGPECSILSPDFCSGAARAALALVLVDSRRNENARFVDAGLLAHHVARSRDHVIHRDAAGRGSGVDATPLP